MISALEGNIVDVRHGEVYPARVEWTGDEIVAVDTIQGDFSGFILPGLIDSHIHIESSHLCPSRFCEVVVPHGTTAVVADPHEMANVMGVRGIDYMVKDSRAGPLRVFFTAPSCVPATSFETSGAALGAEEIGLLLQRDGFVALGEVMNYPGVVAGDPEVLAKIEVAERLGKPVDGHCPLLTGAELRRYVAAGISTDHECISSDEAREKHEAGMAVMVRQGSASRNLADLADFARTHEFLLVSDDKSASDLIGGHMDRSLAECVAHGVDPIHALRAATINPAAHYGLPLGVIEPGRKADLVKVGNLSTFPVEEVYIGGALVASHRVAKFETRPKEWTGDMAPQRRIPSDFDIHHAANEATVRVIGVLRDEVVTESLTAILPTDAGRILPSLEQDVLKIAVVNRYVDAPVSNGFVKGFQLRRGALASTFAHDSHNIIAVGAAGEDMALAVDALVDGGGGFALCDDGKVTVMNMRVAGIMCTRQAFEVKRMDDLLREKASTMGCRLDDPFMTMSVLSLLVVPHLKIGDRGLFDVDSFSFVDVVSA